jgi:hypothetical protein
MIVVLFVLAAIVLFGSAAAIQILVSPAELHDMGVWLDHPQF